MKQDHIRKDTQQRKKFQQFLEAAGFTFSYRKLIEVIFVISLIAAIIGYIAYQIPRVSPDSTLIIELLRGSVILLLGIPLVFLTFLLLFYFYTDLRIQHRIREIDIALPDFLHLTAANARAGMPIDRAMWSAIRPRFGILAKEIEDVAKKNMTGVDLSVALNEFKDKYEAKMLKRTISLIVEGLETGSEVGELLENIALNIQDLQTRRENMAANVTTYVIFITFSVAVAAPLLYAISMQLLDVVHTMGAQLLGATSETSMGLSISLSVDAVKESDFFVFCIVSLCMSSIMSSIVISTIKSGGMGQAVKQIPGFIIVAVSLFLIARYTLQSVFGGLL